MIGQTETRSPTFTSRTPGPISTTVPENSWPSVCGRVTPVSGCGVLGVTIGPIRYSCRSVPQMPQYATSTTTSVGALIVGTGTSSILMSFAA